MFCSKCGNKISGTANFCHKCGNVIIDSTGGHFNDDSAVNKNFDFKKLFYKIFFIISGIFTVIYFFIFLEEENILSALYYSLWAALIWGLLLGLLITILIKWIRGAYYFFSGKKNESKINSSNIENPSDKAKRLKGNRKAFVIAGIVVCIWIMVSLIMEQETTYVSENDDSKTENEKAVVNTNFKADSKNIKNVSKVLTDNKENISSAVVNIYCSTDEEYEIEEEMYGGSGVMIGKDGLIITNSHVIPQVRDVLLVSKYGCLVFLPNHKTGSPEEIYYAQPLVYEDISDEYDLAYLQIYDIYEDENGEAFGEYPKKFITYNENPFCSDDNIELGKQLRVYGYPSMSGGLSLTITDGIISSLPGEGLILTSAKIDSGNSGGLAIDSDDCFVGVPSSVMSGTYENMGVVISKKLVEKFKNKADSEAYSLLK